jgi:hypothetical protein
MKHHFHAKKGCLLTPMPQNIPQPTAHRAWNRHVQYRIQVQYASMTCLMVPSRLSDSSLQTDNRRSHESENRRSHESENRGRATERYDEFDAIIQDPRCIQTCIQKLAPSSVRCIALQIRVASLTKSRHRDTSHDKGIGRQNVKQ